MIKHPFLSVIIPVYNEERALGNIPKVVRFLKRLPYATELLVVNDGSSDTTGLMLQLYQKRQFCRVFSYARHKGKGCAVRLGMLAARGEVRIMTDIDFSVPLSFIQPCVVLSRTNDVVIASRRHAQSRVLVHQPFLREYAGILYHKLSCMLLNLPYKDQTCGFKLFTKRAAASIFPKLRTDGWVFDTEALILAQREGLNIREMPVVWRNYPDTKVRFLTDMLRSIYDLLAIRLRLCRMEY